ncbi:MAG TPA: ABC transporter transmembrane domain-containing protein [Xanthobacteraceae bacterium]|nr:ABC transporter transmembrane domain-containing protein [Xanthobacteraceae bacterium]
MTEHPARAAPAPAVVAAEGGVAPFRQLVPYVMRYRVRAILALIALLVAALTTLAVPIAVRRMIDFGFTTQGVELINSYFTVLILAAATLALASASRFYLVTTLGERIVADLRSEVFLHLTTLTPAFFDRTQTGEVLSRLTADTTQIKAAVGASVSVALRNLVLFIGAATMMMVTSLRLSGFVLLVIPLIVLPLVAFGRVVRNRARLAQDTLADASAYAAEQIGAVRIVQAFNNEPLAVARFTQAVGLAFRTARNSTMARAFLTAIVIFLVFTSVVVVLWVGAQDVIDKQMSPGRLGQFVLFTVFAAGALGELSQVWGEISAASGAAERLFEILAVRSTLKAPAQPVALRQVPRAEVAFDKVRFAYPTRPSPLALDDVSFLVNPGEKVAIVGPSGAGKSTIFHLLLRFYDPTAGTIRFDGVALTDMDPVVLRRHIALVPQDGVVFATSIRENIRFGRPEATDAEIESAAETAALTEVIGRLPQGYETLVGERGVTLSGGERQRIAIARAVLRQAPLLLLDEATSSLDAASETVVTAALERLMKDRTTLVIAHRLSTVLSCDRILVMDKGHIVEQGTHAALVEQGGLYARLAKLQFEGV